MYFIMKLLNSIEIQNKNIIFICGKAKNDENGLVIYTFDRMQACN